MFPVFDADVSMFWRVQDSVFIFDGYVPQAGRFFPAAFMDTNFLALFTSNPQIYFLFNALEFIIILLIIFYLSKKIYSNALFFILFCFVMFFNNAFVTTFTSICIPERMQILCFAIFILGLYKIFVESSTLKIWYILCVVSALYALFLKETSFIVIGGIGFLMLCFHWLDSKIHKKEFILSKSQIILLSSFIVMSILFLLIYALLIMPEITRIYNKNSNDNVVQWITSVTNTASQHPFIILFLPSLLIYRIYAYCKNKIAYPLYDGFLIVSVAYCLAFVALRLFDTYYLTPCYILALLPTLFFAKSLLKIHKFIAIVCFILHLSISFAQSLNTYTQYKIYVPHYLDSIKFIANYTKQHENTNIFLYGQSRVPHGPDWYDLFRAFLLRYGAVNFDLKTDMPNPQSINHISRKDSNLTYFNSLEVSTPQKGDLIHLDYKTFKFMDKSVLDSLAKEYELIFSSQYTGVLAIHAKALIKYLLKDTSFYQNYTKADPNIVDNIFRAPNGVYIYRVR